MWKDSERGSIKIDREKDREREMKNRGRRHTKVKTGSILSFARRICASGDIFKQNLAICKQRVDGS